MDFSLVYLKPNFGHDFDENNHFCISQKKNTNYKINFLRKKLLKKYLKLS